MYTPKGRALAEEIVKKKKYVGEKKPQDLIMALNRKSETTMDRIRGTRKDEKDMHREAFGD